MAAIPEALSFKRVKHVMFCEHTFPSSLFMISIMTKASTEYENLHWCLFRS